MKMRCKYFKLKWVAAGTGILLLFVVGGLGLRTYRMAEMAYDFEAQVRYMIDSGGTIGAVPAHLTFSDLYLEAIFGNNPELLDQLRVVIRRGITEDPDLNLGEVAAMIVTHREDEEGRVIDVVAHVIGGFPLGRLAPQFHRDGFFRNQLDENLWSMGNSVLRFAGRDMIMFADEAVAEEQSEVLEGIFTGNIIPLVNRLETPIFYTAVLPNPSRIVPDQLRHHIQAVIYRGALSPYNGHSELVLLATSPRSANYAMRVVNDLKRMAEIALQSKFGGAVRETAWGEMTDAWWAYEMAEASRNVTIEREENIVRLSTDYDRVMVNAVLKSIERFGRDWRKKQLSLDDRVDPREIDRLMATRKPLHYWSEEHRWGPNWPIGQTPEEKEIAEKTAALDQADTEVLRAEAAAQQAAAALERARQQNAQTPEGTDTAAAEAQQRLQEAQQRAAEAREAAEQARLDLQRAEAAHLQAMEQRRQQLRR
jgi:hypothetical protein